MFLKLLNRESVHDYAPDPEVFGTQVVLQLYVDVPELMPADTACRSKDVIHNASGGAHTSCVCGERIS